MPIVAFIGGSLWRREEIRTIITDEHLRSRGRFGDIFRWLVPVFFIGGLTFLLPGMVLGQTAYDIAFLAAMGAIGTVVTLASLDISIFMIDTGLLFEAFFTRMGELAVPAFAFLTFYSLLVIVFAALYRIVDLLTPTPQFMLFGHDRTIAFLESLYFSIITLSTVGYGDIVPLTSLIRLLSSIQIVLGVLLLLFGFSEIREFSRERREREKARR
jgi:voltage-gated potassium channel